VACQSGTIAVTVPAVQLEQWACSDGVGIYADVELGDNHRLSVAIEKDFACLDRSDTDNQDTFPNPNLAAAC
jgi:hypothetical protein